MDKNSHGIDHRRQEVQQAIEERLRRIEHCRRGHAKLRGTARQAGDYTWSTWSQRNPDDMLDFVLGFRLASPQPA